MEHFLAVKPPLGHLAHRPKQRSLRRGRLHLSGRPDAVQARPVMQRGIEPCMSPRGSALAEDEMPSSCAGLSHVQHVARQVPQLAAGDWARGV